MVKNWYTFTKQFLWPVQTRAKYCQLLASRPHNVLPRVWPRARAIYCLLLASLQPPSCKTLDDDTTGWPNLCNMSRVSMLQYTALKCCACLTGTLSSAEKAGIGLHWRKIIPDSSRMRNVFSAGLVLPFTRNWVESEIKSPRFGHVSGEWIRNLKWEL